MTVARLLTLCRRRGITLAANGQRLAFDAPAGAMTPDLREWLKTAKPELVAVMATDYAAAAKIVLARVPDARRDDLRELFRERWSVCAEDGGLSDAEASRIAYQELAAEAERLDLADTTTAIAGVGVSQPAGNANGVIHPANAAASVGHQQQTETGARQ